MKRVFGFIFGPAKVWERKLVVARIVLIAVMTLVLYALMHSSWKSLVAPLFWVLLVAVVASIAYQYIRRSREQKLASEAEAKPRRHRNWQLHHWHVSSGKLSPAPVAASAGRHRASGQQRE